MEASIQLQESDCAAPHRTYVLVLSGTFDPPTKAHAIMGMHAASTMKALGHVVLKSIYLPVHDNYVVNKAAATDPQASDIARCMPMKQRCKLLEMLLRSQGADATHLVLPYEDLYAQDLLRDSPNYWAKRLPQGHLRTIATADLLLHVATNRELVGNARLGLVFGADNLSAMSGWENTSRILENADLVLIARPSNELLRFQNSPDSLLACIRYIETNVVAPVLNQNGRILFGNALGRFRQPAARGDSTIFMLPALNDASSNLSSTNIRRALNVLCAHGYSTPQLAGALLSSLSLDAEGGFATRTRLPPSGM